MASPAVHGGGGGVVRPGAGVDRVVAAGAAKVRMRRSGDSAGVDIKRHAAAVAQHFEVGISVAGQAGRPGPPRPAGPPPAARTIWGLVVRGRAGRAWPARGARSVAASPAAASPALASRRKNTV